MFSAGNAFRPALAVTNVLLSGWVGWSAGIQLCLQNTALQFKLLQKVVWEAVTPFCWPH